MESFYSSGKEIFSKLIGNAVKENSIAEIEKSWVQINTGDQDKRNILDSVLKDYLLEICDSITAVESLVTVAVALSRADLCSASTPVVLLSDVFDLFTLADCGTLFNYVEKNVSIWKDELLFSACKNNLLRMCNDLLRRLSRSQNTVFRGRILLFLASFFPFSERSGLNLVSEFNLENANEYKKEVCDEPMESEDGEINEEETRVDYNLYTKFLTLQDFFRNPTQCYNKLRWGAFALSWTDTFQTFQNVKLDDVDVKRKTPREHLEGAGSTVFFVKYMNNPRLLQLQLRDPNFRRSMILQGLLTLQYLNSPVKSKLDSYELRPVQQEWIKEQETLLYNLLAESPRGSERFRDIVRHILSREQLWNNWKNEGCPEFKRPGAVEEVSNERKPSLKRKSAGDLIRSSAKNGKYFMGNKEISRLWNLSSDNLNVCLGEGRAFVPTLESYLGEAVTQMDPAAGIEPQFKLVNEPNFCWRALRLLAQRSPCFFASTNDPIQKCSDFIELSLKKLLKEQHSLGSEEIELPVTKEEGEEDPKELPSSTQPDEPKMSEEALDGVASRLGEHWLKLATKLGYKSHKTALEMLKTWSAEDEDASPENLAHMLEGLGLLEASEYLKTKWCKCT